MFDRRLKAGRTKPPLVLARDENEVLRKAVLKPPGDQSPAEFLVEWLSFWVGRALGLDCAEIVALAVKEPFASNASDDPATRQLMMRSRGVVAGSVWFDGLLQDQNEKLSKSERNEAQKILGFDVYIHNPDRRHNNPNLDRKPNGLRFALFDHEYAMSFRLPGMVLNAPPPETDSCENIILEHVFYGGLRKKKIPFKELESSLEKLTDEWFSELGAVAPTIWFPNGSKEQLATILDVLRKRRDQAATWLKGVQRWLT